MARTIRNRVLGLLVRRGLWRHEDETEVEESPQSLLPFLAAASIQGQSLLEPGRPPERVAIGPKRERDERVTRAASLSHAIDGFSLHAGVRVEAKDRERLEHLCRYVTRPPIATERLSVAPGGKVTYRLRRAWRDGTTHVVFTQRGRYRWAELLRRVFDVDVLRSAHCGGKQRLLALIQDPLVVRRILGHLGLPTEQAPIAPARAPPQGKFAFP